MLKNMGQMLAAMAAAKIARPMLVTKVGQDPGSTAISDVCERAAKDCIAAAKIAGPADVAGDGEGLEPQE